MSLWFYLSIECFIQAELEYNVEKVGTSQKSISRKPLAYTKRKRNGGKKTLCEKLYYLSLEIDENNIESQEYVKS